MESQLEKLYTVEDIAKVLGIQVDSARKLCNRMGLGRLIGKRRYITPEEWEDLLDKDN